MKTTRKAWTRSLFALNLIKESDLAARLHFALHNLHIEPGVLMGLRSRNDDIPKGERVFIMASIKKAWMEGDTPVKVNNFAKKKEGEVNG